jgi:hypothetical protein
MRWDPYNEHCDVDHRAWAQSAVQQSSTFEKYSHHECSSPLLQSALAPLFGS